uniref:DUF6589 domain-containing protein n=1 Tax=Moniliophthora roreri TaxID=221103 RepID=A0A0W0GC76_MONRR
MPVVVLSTSYHIHVRKRPEVLQPQIISHKDTQENGICATIWPLHNAKIKDLNLDEFKKAFNEATPLELTDILHTAEEQDFFHKCLIHTILCIIITYGGEGFARFKDDLTKTLPELEEKIEPHVTPVYPLSSWPIDESTIKGSGEVDKAFVEELKLKESLT